MGFSCKLLGHKWEGCKCARCGEKRDTEHDWIVTDCAKKCSRCGKVITVHKWEGCKCIVCGEARDEQHKYKGAVCSVCGAKSRLSPENLKKLNEGMTTSQVKAVIGEPNLVNSGANAVGSMLGRGGLNIGGSQLMASMQSKEYWLYETSAGNFQILMDNGKISMFSGLEYIIEKLEKEEKEDKEEKEEVK